MSSFYNIKMSFLSGMPIDEIIAIIMIVIMFLLIIVISILHVVWQKTGKAPIKSLVVYFRFMNRIFKGNELNSIEEKMYANMMKKENKDKNKKN